MAVKGVQKDIGDGVFRDKNGKVIPRENFSEDPDFDVPMTAEEAYAASVRAGVPRDFAAEETLDQEMLAKFLPDVFAEG